MLHIAHEIIFAVGMIEETKRIEMLFYIRLLFQSIGCHWWWSVLFKWSQQVMVYDMQYIILHTSFSVITWMQHSNFHWITFISTCNLYLQTISDTEANVILGGKRKFDSWIQLRNAKPTVLTWITKPPQAFLLYSGLVKNNQRHITNITALWQCCHPYWF